MSPKAEALREKLGEVIDLHAVFVQMAAKDVMRDQPLISDAVELVARTIVAELGITEISLHYAHAEGMKDALATLLELAGDAP